MSNVSSHVEMSQVEFGLNSLNYGLVSFYTLSAIGDINFNNKCAMGKYQQWQITYCANAPRNVNPHNEWLLVWWSGNGIRHINTTKLSYVEPG